MRVEMPGIGGNLGECVICGKTFLTEILLGRKVATMHMEGFSGALPVHATCLDELEALGKKHGDDTDSWQYLPEGPLRQEFARAVNEAKAQGAKEEK